MDREEPEEPEDDPVSEAWPKAQARQIVRDAHSYHGQSWLEMSYEQRVRACAPGIVRLVVCQAQQFEDTLAHLQAVAALVCEEVKR